MDETSCTSITSCSGRRTSRGCAHCSFWADNLVSSFANDFNFDYGVSFTPEHQNEAVYNWSQSPRGPEQEGASVFRKDESGRVFHTYSTYARGIDMVNTAYRYLDLVPKGRDEERRAPQHWVSRHDEYAR
jgi:predicted dithiol-disulfide oxidoreductase (DUF899 family)